MGDLDSFDSMVAALKPDLEPGEVPIWVGCPLPRRFAGHESGAIVAGVILMLVGMGGVWLALFADGTVGFGKPAPNPSAALLPLFAGLVFGAAGISSWHHAFRLRERLPRAVYAVTNRRALVVNGFRHSRRGDIVFDRLDWSFSPSAIRGREVKRRRRDGSGDIVFDVEDRRGAKGRRVVIEAGFFGVPEVDQVDTLLEKIAASPTKMDLDRVFE